MPDWDLNIHFQPGWKYWRQIKFWFKYSKWLHKFINCGLNNFFGNLQYYYHYTYSFMKLLISLNYAKQNGILELLELILENYHLFPWMGIFLGLAVQNLTTHVHKLLPFLPQIHKAWTLPALKSFFSNSISDLKLSIHWIKLFILSSLSHLNLGFKFFSKLSSAYGDLTDVFLPFWILFLFEPL